MIENDSFGSKNDVFGTTSTNFQSIFDINRPISIKELTIDRLKDRFYIDKGRFNRNYTKINRFYIKIVIDDSIKSLESESTIIRQSNSDRDFDSRTTIRFGILNHISLPH